MALKTMAALTISAAEAVTPQPTNPAELAALNQEMRSMGDRYSPEGGLRSRDVQSSDDGDGYLDGEPIPHNLDLDKRVDKALSHNPAFNAALATANKNAEGIRYTISEDAPYTGAGGTPEWEKSKNVFEGRPYYERGTNFHALIPNGPNGGRVRIAESYDESGRKLMGYGDDGEIYEARETNGNYILLKQGKMQSHE